MTHDRAGQSRALANPASHHFCNPSLRLAGPLSSVAPPRDDTPPLALAMNPLVYFEIPVADMKRACLFYERVFEVSLELREIDGNEMALFPQAEGAPGAPSA